MKGSCKFLHLRAMLIPLPYSNISWMRRKNKKMDRTTQGNIRVADHKRLGGVWRTMINRCELPSTRHYGRYGRRGIKVCEEWHIFSNFYKWAIENGYDEDAPRGQYTIDRINNDGDYTPLEWCNILKLDRSFVNNRINQYHWDEKTSLVRTQMCKVYAALYRNRRGGSYFTRVV